MQKLHQRLQVRRVCLVLHACVRVGGQSMQRQHQRLQVRAFCMLLLSRVDTIL
jgi:hypothetical protein